MTVKLYLLLVLSYFWFFLPNSSFKLRIIPKIIAKNLAYSFTVSPSSSLHVSKGLSNQELIMSRKFFSSSFLVPYSLFLQKVSQSLSLPVLASETTSETIARQITVRIDRSSGYGSGVIIDRDRNSFYVLTNAHVVDRPDRYRIVTADGMIYTAQSRVIIPDLDLALLSFESDRNYPIAEIEREISSLPTKIRVGGWSKSGGSLRQPIFVTTEGNLTAINSNLPLGYAFTYSNLVRAGMSGGAILNTEGKLIGINGVVRLDNNSNRIVASGIPIDRYWQWRNKQPHLAAINSANRPINRENTLNNPSSSYIVTQTLSAEAAVNSVAVNPVDRTIISGSSDGTIAIWQQGQNKAIARWQNKTSVNAIAVSPDGKTLASGGDNGDIQIWDLANSKQILSITGHRGAITSLVFSPDGKTLISGSWDKTIRIWQPDTGQLVNTLTGHSQIVNAIAISPDGKILASGSQDTTIRLWNLATGKLINVIEGHSLAVLSLAISPDNSILASGSGDGTIKIWQLDTNELVNTLQGHTDGVWGIAIAHDNRTLFSASWDKTIKVWNLNTGILKYTLTRHQDYIASLILSFDSQTLISGDFQGKIYIWQVQL